MANLLDQLIEGKQLTQAQAQSFFADVIAGNVEPALLGAVLTALKIKGETPEEIAGAAIAIREAATPFPQTFDHLADCVGTGGDGANTINISTTAAILAATCGLKMAKHGNRSVSSLSGSADLLEAFGVNLNMTPETAARCVEKANICFLFAPAYHAGFKHAAPVRQALGVRTLFNILGPLVNPAKPNTMLLGVYTPDLLKPMAEALLLTGVKKGWVVHGSGLDEIALHGVTRVIEINNGELSKRIVSPSDFGLKEFSLEHIKGGTPEDNAKIVKTILAGKGVDAHNNAVVINAAALLYLHGKADTLEQASSIAMETLKSGNALHTLDKLVEVSNG